ncbi:MULTISPECIES: septum formation initiator family protein [unclassified Glutamicibacter]|uniref:FtsB family cell division protein n=1 Tax=unclassified Glutamicibacter TaxID=2627139 RepID=UPI003807B6AD
MAQRPPRMPRRNTPDPAEEAVITPVDQTKHDGAGSEAEPPTDALRIVKPQAQARQTPATPRPPKAAPAAQKPRSVAAQPKSTARPASDASREPKKFAGNYAPKPKVPLRERAKEKQNERRRDDRVKFSAAVRRKPGQKPSGQNHVPEGEPVAAHRFSGRIAALIVVLAFFAVMLVPTVNFYRTQMAELNELNASIEALETQRDDLKAEIARWDDPLYIKQQARERINLVMPGEKLYMVVGERPKDEETPADGNGSTFEVRQELPWVDALLDSVRRSATD